MTANRNRSRVTNRPPTNRPGRSAAATGRRVRDLYVAYLERVGRSSDPIVQAQALRAAELTALCESLRARALAGETFDTNDLTRLESTANRAERALVKGAADTADDGPDWVELQEQALQMGRQDKSADHEPEQRP